jgi:hypothetical protein
MQAQKYKRQPLGQEKEKTISNTYFFGFWSSCLIYFANIQWQMIN